ncbi:MAG: sigma-70 family RNA polymerase sigma factor [candidate division KSB1 bacterium]|nr:sigma-70 family RNA polymerase sigma factor [candidate division KSB1 bacterium]
MLFLFMTESKTNRQKPDAESWVDEHGDALYRYALSRISDATMAEDLVQETFLAALRTFHSFDAKSSERTWFISILKHKIIDHYRKQSRRSDLFSDDAAPEEKDYQEDGFWNMQRAPSDWGSQPEEELQRQEFMAVLRRCMEQLPKTFAAVFSLRELEGLSSKAICKELDITSSNLWVLLHRARHRLRRCLEDTWFKVNA